jgi:hypothetical protein
VLKDVVIHGLPMNTKFELFWIFFGETWCLYTVQYLHNDHWFMFFTHIIYPVRSSQLEIISYPAKNHLILFSVSCFSNSLFDMIYVSFQQQLQFKHNSTKREITVHQAKTVQKLALKFKHERKLGWLMSGWNPGWVEALMIYMKFCTGSTTLIKQRLSTN